MLEVGPVESSIHGGTRRLSASLRSRKLSGELWFDLPDWVPSPVWPADAFAVALLRPAMNRGESLQIADGISPRLHAAINGRVQDIFRGWHRLPKIHAGPVSTTPQRRPERATAIAFTGGVDSFDTAIRWQGRASHLLFVHGYDIPLERTDTWEQCCARLRPVARELSAELLCVRTNLRSLTDPDAPWYFHFGAGLATVGHLLSGVVGRLVIPASYSLDSPQPCGSLPHLDPWWSSDALEVIHEGAEHQRVEKIARIGGHPLVRQHLRVCWQNPEGVYNCGRCTKCVRTIIALAACNHLASQEALPRMVDPQLVERLDLTSPTERAFAVENLAAARRHSADAGLIRALERAIGAHQAAATRPARSSTGFRLVPTSPFLRRAARSCDAPSR